MTAGHARWALTAAALVAFAGGGTAVAQVPASAAQPPAQDSLPPADQLLARYHEEMGAEKFAAIQSIHATGQLSVPAAGITGTLEIWQARPDRTLMHAVVSNYGDVRTGFTGESGWSFDPVEGPRVLAGPEAAQAEDDAHFDSHLRTSELVASATTVERTTLGGYDCYKVRMVWKTGRESDDCFSVDTGLLVGSQRVHQSSAGPADALILYEEYRLFGDVRMPTRITTRVNGMDQVVTLEKLELNMVEDSAFDPPPEVAKLLDGR